MGEIAINPTHNVHQKYRQMNLVNPYIFAPPIDLSTNTYIGGVASTIGTASTLATKLAIDVSRITNFSIIGSDIKCKITGSYVIPLNCWNENYLITSYIDTDGLVTDLGYQCFGEAKNIKSVEFKGIINLTGYQIFAVSKYWGVNRVLLPNCVSISNQAFYSEFNCIELVYIPKCTSLGSTSGYNEVFRGSNFSPCIIYAHPSLATNNSGGVDGDLSYRTGVGSIVRFVSNYSLPNNVTTLSASIITSSTVKLDFTYPTGSVNTIEYYECYANGIFKNNIKSSGEYVIGLSTSTYYNITIYAVDIYMNKSLVSNQVAVTTNTSNAVPTANLRSYYKLDELTGTVANDSYGTEHLTNTGVSINQTGKFGKAYKATANAQKLESNTVSPITGSFTISYWTYVTGISAQYASPFEMGVWGGSGFAVWMDSGRVGVRINGGYGIGMNFQTEIPLNEYCMVTVNYDGSNVRIYINAKLKTVTPYTTNPNTSTLRTMFSRSNNTGASYLGILDNVCLYSAALSQNQVDILYNLGYGITL